MQEVLVELNRQNQAKQDFISPAQGMRLREDGQTFEINHLTTSQQEVFGTTSLFHRQVASALGIPAKYYDLMQTQKPELLAENVNSWFADKPSSYMVRSMDYGAGQVARALLSERYRRIDNMEIATAVLPLFAGNDQYEVMSCEVTENRLYLKVVNHRLEMEVCKGDIVQAGVMISNSEVGLGAVSIQPLVNRQLWMNPLSDVMGGWGIWETVNGEQKLTTECIENVIMMVPFSAIVMWTFEEKMEKGWKKIVWQSGKIAFVFSIRIEMLQLLLRLGTFQLSDIFYNTVGGVLGGLMYCAVMKVRKRL